MYTFIYLWSDKTSLKWLSDNLPFYGTTVFKCDKSTVKTFGKSTGDDF